MFPLSTHLTAVCDGRLVARPGLPSTLELNGAEVVEAMAVEASMLGEIERSLATSEAALQGVVTALLEGQAGIKELGTAAVGGMLEELSDTLAGQRKARAEMLGQVKKASGRAGGGYVGVTAALPASANPARESQSGDVNWEFRTLQRVRSLMVREVTALEQARGPVDTERVASLKADINKLSNALCELIAQPQGTPSRHVDRVVRQSLDDAKAALNNGNSVAHAKSSGPSPTITPPEEPVEAGAARGEVATTPQSPPATTRRMPTWRSATR